MNKRTGLIPAAVAAVSALALLTLSACSATDAAGSAGNSGKLKVTASFYPMEFLAGQIGGDHVAVTALTKPGVEPHDLELTPKQTAALGESDVIVYLKGLQPAVDDAVKQSGVKNTADAASLTQLEGHGTEVDGHHHTTGDNHSGVGEAGADPHVWLDPVKYAEVAKGVNTTLAKADPKNAAAYQKNTDALVKKLDALNTQFTDGLKNRASDTFITTHAAFGYLAERYGLVEEAIGGIDPETEPSGARIKALQKLSAEHHVTTVFFETLASNTTAKTLAGDLKLKTDVLDPLEGITDKSKGRDYFEVQQSNLKALQTALGPK
ncbi:metal ABC transporter substrate-binding protein [Streptomyces sp. H10-C2]|uniref:metal ABC transporter substrate-binding protein n=1 Tax=unclassified Streptomyces TaxID=2593676 RepID=UPI0024BBE91C|nr:MULTISPECIES: metal ABC transporter substrate-binding protein [unclassified Streptomyces]MDJ0344610.1 metal ABC transporter substrate-binding protein [Streptomyces sp. PH10-H1]MDJ0373230.1 metal ABC transporter substrate-binding protein [Streptomyces sp. H10-C2]